MVTQNRDLILYCSRCGKTVEECAVCERAECPHKMCYRCLRIEIGESMDHPHDHGG